MSDILQDFITTVDGQDLQLAQARKVSKRRESQSLLALVAFLVRNAQSLHLHMPVYLGGFLLLPWSWLANVWLFWPELKHARDPLVYKCKRCMLHLELSANSCFGTLLWSDRQTMMLQTHGNLQ